jgi:hypothetical protein
MIEYTFNQLKNAELEQLRWYELTVFITCTIVHTYTHYYCIVAMSSKIINQNSVIIYNFNFKSIDRLTVLFKFYSQYFKFKKEYILMRKSILDTDLNNQL